ncbi:hypothetical protein MMC11_003903 [Xylographa trunciseda]|nr:hypothetical protein [Xylographa trunciseda]
MDFSHKTTFELAGREFPRVTWYTNPGMRKTYICLMFVVLTSTLDAWQDYFGHPTGSLLGLFSCIMSVGSICAIPIVPYTADLLGRRTGVFIGCVIMILGVVLQSISINFRMFVAARFFIGFGVAIAHGSSPLLITELVHTQHRAIFTTIYNTTWYFGSIVAAWLTFGTNNIVGNWSWRTPSLVQAFPSILQLCFIWFVPESPRYHIAKGRHEKALQILADCHANGDTQDEVVQLEMQEIRDTIKMEQEFEGNAWSELWRTKGNRHRLVILITAGFFSQWSGNGLVSYYINIVLKQIGITDSTTQQLINGILQIINFIVALTMCFFVDKIGRRKLFLTSTAGMLGAFIVWTICSAVQQNTGNTHAATAVVVMIFLYYVFYNLAWSGLLVGYTVEILPYNIRAKGMTVVWLSVDLSCELPRGKDSMFFNQYVNPIALDAIGWKYYIVYCVWLAVELAVVWFFYIETRNTPLEEIVKHFDGEGAVLGGGAATQKGLKLAGEMGIDTTAEVGDEKAPVIDHKELAS